MTAARLQKKRRPDLGSDEGDRRLTATLDNVLLLTATIAPRSNTFQLARTDPGERLEDYCQALSYYLDMLPRGVFRSIVFVDNSGYPLDRLQALVADRGLSDRVDFISYEAEDESQMGRFYLELKLLIEAMGRPPLSQMPASTRIWKVTGRYIVHNIEQIVRSAPRDADLYVNSRNRPRRWTDFYLAAFNHAAFRKVLADHLDDYRARHSGEEVLREQIEQPSVASLRIVPRMRRVPHLTGRRGLDNGKYGAGKDLAKYWLRVAVDRMIPSLWI